MPDKHGFDHLVDRGSIRRRCIWCTYSPPVLASEAVLARHARKHKKDAELAAEASLRERRIAEPQLD